MGKTLHNKQTGIFLSKIKDTVAAIEFLDITKIKSLHKLCRGEILNQVQQNRNETTKSVFSYLPQGYERNKYTSEGAV